MQKITEISLMKVYENNGFCTVIGRIPHGHDLTFECVANGAVSREITGHEKYEHSITVNRVLKDTVLLLLLKEKFSSVLEFKNWLRKNEISCEEDMWPRAEL